MMRERLLTAAPRITCRDSLDSIGFDAAREHSAQL